MRKKKRAPKDVIKAAVNLFAFVDEHPGKPQVKRVNAILELLQAIRKRKDLWKRAKRLDQLQRAFRRYQWTREILFTTEGPHEWVTWAKQRGDDDWEHEAVHILLILAEYYPDYLSKIDRCSVCSRWMLTRKSDQRFCSGRCRQYEYDNDTARREQHRANMRRLYRTEKERSERAKREV
jgi:predicted nucleic acid-binding Zn ribbon protein